MKTLAAILTELKKPLIIDEIEIPPLKKGQALVEIKYSGVCHTQILEVMGHRGSDPFLPHLLGHEGSGIVVDVGPNVEKIKIGDNVILSWLKGQGADVSSTKYMWKNKIVNSGAITTFSKYSIVSENRLTVVPEKFPLKEAALLGCAVPTGIGAVFNTAKPKPGQSLAVFGCGGVGLCALQGAVISGCYPLIAVDLQENKLQAAKKLGATHLINATKKNPEEEIKKICSLDFAIEASGSPSAMQQALHSVRNLGGCVVIIGNAHHGKNLVINPKQFNLGKKIFGSWGGENIPHVHFPRYCNLISNKYLNLDHLFTDVFSLQNINQAIEKLQDGKTLRPIIDMSL